jgi:hypothetical protein
MNHLLIHNVGHYLIKTNIGYYKQQFMYLLNQELYLYENRNADTYKRLITLTPGVLLQMLKPVLRYEEISKELKKKKGLDGEKVYPIEVFVGGTISNIGIEFTELSGGD